MNNNKEWIDSRVAYIKGLKNPTKQQELLLLLVTANMRSDDDEKMLKALVKAEKAAIAADKAKADVTKRLNAAAKEADKKRTHELIQSGLLLIAAGLADSKNGKLNIDRAELVGALSGISKLPDHHEKRQLWQKEGTEILAKYEGRKPKAAQSLNTPHNTNHTENDDLATV